MDNEMNSKVYEQTDDQGRITRCEGGYTTPADLSGWTKIDEGHGDRYNLCQSNYFEGGLCTDDGVPRYKMADGKPVERTAKEMAADLAAMVRPVTFREQIRADVDFLAAMGGVEL